MKRVIAILDLPPRRAVPTVAPYRNSKAFEIPFNELRDESCSDKS